MLDKSIPYAGVIMTMRDAGVYPKHTMPEGYSLACYETGAERGWAEIIASVGEVGSIEEGLTLFGDTFGVRPELIGRRNLFVVTNSGTAVATASLWEGEHFGVPLPRVHWVACRPEHQRRGLVKALLTSLLDLQNDLALGKFLYLTTQTWSYKAVGLYRKFNFVPYMGAKPANWGNARYAGYAGIEGGYEEVNAAAWRLIDAKLEGRS